MAQIERGQEYSVSYALVTLFRAVSYSIRSRFKNLSQSYKDYVTEHQDEARKRRMNENIERIKGRYLSE